MQGVSLADMFEDVFRCRESVFGLNPYIFLRMVSGLFTSHQLVTPSAWLSIFKCFFFCSLVLWTHAISP